MNSKTLKFLVTDSVITLALLLFLRAQFSVVGLVGVLLFGGLLFLGTLTDKNKSWLGVANKFAYVAFCTLMGILAVIEGVPIEHGEVVVRIRFVERSGAIIAGVVLLLFFIVAATVSGNRKIHYAVRVPLRYLGLLLLMSGLMALFGFPVAFVVTVDMIIAMFLAADLFSCKLRVDRFGVEHGKRFDNGYWMALGVTSALVLSMMFSGGYWYRILAAELPQTLRAITGGVITPLFVMVMLVLAMVYLFADIKENTGNIFDSYLPCALAGFSLTLLTYAEDGTTSGLVVLILTAVALFAMGLYTVNLSHATHPENGAYGTLRYGLTTDIIGLVIGLGGMLSMLLVNEGYLAAVLVLVGMIVAVLIVWRKARGGWITDSIKWQLILVTEFVFALVMAIIDGCIEERILVYLPVLLISSLAMWGLGIRTEKKGNGWLLFARIFVCLLFGAVAVLPMIGFR